MAAGRGDAARQRTAAGAAGEARRRLRRVVGGVAVERLCFARDARARLTAPAELLHLCAFFDGMPFCSGFFDEHSSAKALRM
jgi:hypothetical protein